MSYRKPPKGYEPAFAEKAFRLCMLNLTDEEIADSINIPLSTMNEWKAAFPAFREAFVRGRDDVDSKAAVKLYERATGYDAPATRIFLRHGDAEPVYAHYTEHYPPDVNAISLWLRNRRPRQWKDKVELQHSITSEPREITNEELLAIVDGSAKAVSERRESTSSAQDVERVEVEQEDPSDTSA